MELRKANKTDKAAVLALYRSAIGSEGCVWDENYPAESDLDGDISAQTLYVYTDGGDIVGAVSVRPQNELDELPVWKVRDGRHCELVRVVISRERRGEGLSVGMLTELLRHLKSSGVSAVHLLAAKKNPPAQALYRRIGFEFYGETFIFGHDYLMAELNLRKCGFGAENDSDNS